MYLICKQQLYDERDTIACWVPNGFAGGDGVAFCPKILHPKVEGDADFLSNLPGRVTNYSILSLTSHFG